RSVWFFFFQAEDGIRDFHVTGVQTCALPIYPLSLKQINYYVDLFIKFAGKQALNNSGMVFKVTPIGTGLAGYRIEDIAPMFKARSEERRVGKECRYRQSTDDEKKTDKQTEQR